MLEDADGLAELRRIGARSVPVLSRGDDWVFAQNLSHVVKFLGLNERTGPALSPDQLAAKVDLILGVATRLLRQMPDSEVETEAPGRPRSYRRLAHHIFQIQDALMATANGATLTNELPGLPPPDDMKTFADLAAHGDAVRARYAAWWRARPDHSGKDPVQTYYGPQILHETMERATWHSGQHVRQWAMLLGLHGITPDRPLTEADLAGLPMPANVWDG